MVARLKSIVATTDKFEIKKNLQLTLKAEQIRGILRGNLYAVRSVQSEMLVGREFIEMALGSEMNLLHLQHSLVAGGMNSFCRKCRFNVARSAQFGRIVLKSEGFDV